MFGWSVVQTNTYTLSGCLYSVFNKDICLVQKDTEEINRKKQNPN